MTDSEENSSRSGCEDTFTSDIVSSDVWTEEDKIMFIQAIKSCGISNINRISQRVPNRTKQEISDFINHHQILCKYSEELRKYKNTIKMVNGKVVCFRVPRRQNSCLEKWLNKLKKSKIVPKHFNALSFCMKLLSDFVNYGRTNRGGYRKVRENGVDFHQLYLYMSNKLQDKISHNLNKDTMMFIQNVLEDMAGEHRKQRPFKKEIKFLRKVRLYKPEKSETSSQTYDERDSGSQTIKNIQQNEDLNPLNVPLNKFVHARK